jgi:hypothetical protein
MGAIESLSDLAIKSLSRWLTASIFFYEITVLLDRKISSPFPQDVAPFA